ncbi:M14 family metallopeptidase [uncultured Bacteroides sp.]|uniref:M14 family metallopeptidase n=1 Tax=uncultured Bacteroides sp. TaxID=162156 RepID=UPI002AA8A142|nr:M14 family metallopeptidase [uncultured Bacteroides sp.]
MKKQILLFIVFFCCLSMTSLAQELPILSKGEGVLTYKEYTPFADRPVDVHYYIPPSGNMRQMPILFVFEGADRGYRYLLKAWKEEAEKKKFMIFIPHFDVKLYPLSDYQETGVLNEERTAVRAQSLQTPALIDKIFEYVKLHSGSERKTYMIYGHSAGGQFVQRFMLFYDSPYVEKAIIGSPGWYTYPDTTLDFSYGVGNIPYITPEVIKKYLAKNIVLQLATGDTIRESFLRKTPEAESQGRNRYERGSNFYLYLHKIAADNNWPCNWMKVEEQGIGHNSVGMGKRAVPYLFGDSVRALFIGNSYTYYNKMVQMVKSIATSNGKKLAVKMIEHGGWTLKQHAANAETLEAIKEGGWDFVVLQEHSEGPAQEKEWVRKNVYMAANSLDSLRRLYNPQGKTVFYMTWGHQIDTYARMQQRLAESYLEMTSHLNAWCAPVGIAWKRVRTESPGLVLYDPDHSHPSLAGSYLAANVFYSALFQKPYTSTYDAGLPKEEALYLQRTAQETVLSNLSLWNIQPKAQPDDVVKTFYPESPLKYDTPTLSKPMAEGLASLNEIRHYLQLLADSHPDKVKLEIMGRTPEGKEVYALYFGTGKNRKKVKVWIQAGLHGNEPAGPEAACILAEYLLNTSEGASFLKEVDLALVPVANPDGYALQHRQSGSGLDLNRDQTKLMDPVSCFLKKNYADWNPEIALDIHEFNPIRKEFALLRGNDTSIASDVLFLLSGHLNVPIGLRNISNGLFRQEAEKALKENGYSSGFYFTPIVKNGVIYAVKDAQNPQSSSTSQALSNAISLFIEIRGVGLGRDSFNRRAESGFLVARSLLQTACEHQREVKKVVHEAIKETCADKDNIYVTFQAKQTEYPVAFLDIVKKERFTQSLPTFDALQLQPILIRKRPRSYILSDSCLVEVEKLRILGIKVERAKKSFTALVQKYIVTECKRSDKKWEKINPTKVSTQLKEEKKSFPVGSFIVDLSQKNANLAVSLLEPESANGFISFGVTKAKPNQELPVYRR